jgi:UTP--glucose-1-phosphate uridylyltransferase
MAVVTGRGKRAIEDHFDNSFELESQLKGTSKEHYLHEIKNVINKSTFTYVRQQKMLGLGHAILTGEPLIGDEAFAVILADDLCSSSEKGVIEQMIEKYEQYKCSIVAIQEVPINEISNYGVVDGRLIDNSDDTYLVSSMIEKPSKDDSPSNMAIIGRYILTPDIFEILREIKVDDGGELQITDALLEQAKNGKVIAYKFKGKRFDCGNVIGYVKATNYFAKMQKFIYDFLLNYFFLKKNSMNLGTFRLNYNEQTNLTNF